MSMGEKPTQLDIIRHGKSETNNAHRRLEAGLALENVPTDVNSSLTEDGKRQAWSRGEEEAPRALQWKASDIVVISSTHTRAQQTADIIVARLNAYRAEDDQVILQEPDERFGEYAMGITDPAYIAKYPELLRRTLLAMKHNIRERMYVRPAHDLTEREKEIADQLGLVTLAEREGEAMVDIEPRLRNGLADLEPLINQDGKLVILVCHGGASIMLRKILLDENPEDLITLLEAQRNAGIPIWNGARSTYQRRKDGTWDMVVWNSRLASETTSK